MRSKLKKLPFCFLSVRCQHQEICLGVEEGGCIFLVLSSSKAVSTFLCCFECFSQVSAHPRLRPSVPSPNRSVSAALMCSSWPLPSSFYVCVSFKTSSSLESSLYTTPSYICMCSLPFPLICDCSSGFYFFVLVFILESLALGHSYISSELLSNLRYLSYFALCFLPWL